MPMKKYLHVQNVPVYLLPAKKHNEGYQKSCLLDIIWLYIPPKWFPIRPILKNESHIFWTSKDLIEYKIHCCYLMAKCWTLTCFIYTLDSLFSSSFKFWSSNFPSSSILAARKVAQMIIFNHFRCHLSYFSSCK